MKRVININFQGRVIPIEESAQEILKQYVESLRRYFAKEEGAEEIINDIEGRVAELFSELLKKGNTCITDADVQQIIAGMGRPEDFEAEDQGGTFSNEGTASPNAPGSGSRDTFSGSKGRFYRNADDRIVAGVASGLANFLGIDPVVMRIIFVLLFGALFWVYILLWIIVPSQSLQTSVTKRLYRSQEQKMLAGVCGGLAAYFNIDVWIPRVIFLLPVLLSIVSGPFDFWDSWHIWIWPKFITGSLSGTLFITYIILWIAVPVATTAAQKLEMRGERIDMHSIRDRVKVDMETLKGKAKSWGNEVRESAGQFKDRAAEMGTAATQQARQFASEAAPVASKVSWGIGNLIAVLVKIFLLFIAGVIALALFAVLIALFIAGYVAFPMADYVLEGIWQPIFTWGFLLLFLGIPFVAMLTWLIRRIMGVRSKRHYLGYAFGLLFFLGIVSTFLMMGSLIGNFKYKSGTEEAVPLSDTGINKLYVKVTTDTLKRKMKWWHWENNENRPFDNWGKDSFLLNTVKLEIVKSWDGQFHFDRIATSRGSSEANAAALAKKIAYPIEISDSTIVLPSGFFITPAEKFRNQQVRVVLHVPVGKRIQLEKGVFDFSFFTIFVNQGNGIHVEVEDDWDKVDLWSPDQEYVMTESDGLVRTEDLDPEALKRGTYRKDPSIRPEVFPRERIREGIRKKMDSVEQIMDSLQEILKRKVRPMEEATEKNESAENNPRSTILDPSIHIIPRLF